MHKAAIYARVSKDDEDHRPGHETSDSVSRQVEGARAFITSKGWTLNEAHVYVDDGVSGALFVNRAEFQRMLQDAERGAFNVLVIYDLDRFGRHAQKAMEALNWLVDLGVEVVDYSTGQVVDLDSFEGRITASLRTEFAQQYREQVRKHTRDGMLDKWQKGFIVGCRIFGYDNVGKKGEKVRHVNVAEAAVVQEIYERYANGEGYKSIAWALNARGLPAPRAQRGRPNGWDPGTIRAVLDNSIYRGVETYRRSRKLWDRELKRFEREGRLRPRAGREKTQVMRPASEWLQRDVPHLRIIGSYLAARVEARRAEKAAAYLQATTGQPLGRPGNRAKYLLSGLLRCPCGASLEALKGGRKSRGKQPLYVCAARRRKGPAVCRHEVALPIAATDDAILSVIEDDVLSPRFISWVLASLPGEPTDDRPRMVAERDRLTVEVANLTTGVRLGGDIPTLVEQLRACERQLRQVEAQLVPKEAPDREVLRRALERKVAEWKEVLRAHPQQARLIIERLIGPLEVDATPTPHWVAQPRPQTLLASVEFRMTPHGLFAELVHGVASPTGKSADGLVHGVASPAGFEPAFQP